jgi:hypothetical protein
VIDDIDVVRCLGGVVCEPSPEVRQEAYARLQEAIVGEGIDSPPAVLRGAEPAGSSGRGFDERRRSSRRPLRRVLVGALVVMVIGGLITGLLNMPGTTPPSAAAAALDHLASEAAAAAPTTLGPGQYLYTETRGPVLSSASGGGSGYESFRWYQLGTVQEWVDAQGAGRVVITGGGPAQFFTPADRAAWIADGSPPIGDPPNMIDMTRTYQPGPPPPVVEPGKGPYHLHPYPAGQPIPAPLPVYDVSKLPTDVSTLRSEIAQGTTGIPAIDHPTGLGFCTSAACQMFSRTSDLLQGPELGSTPALRAALFQVLASIPGIRLLGTVTDHDGQSGLGFELVAPASSTSATCNGTKETVPPTSQPTTFEIVVDPTTTTVLGTSHAPPPTVDLPCAGVVHEMPGWRDLVASAVVGNDTATS